MVFFIFYQTSRKIFCNFVRDSISLFVFATPSKTKDCNKAIFPWCHSQFSLNFSITFFFIHWFLPRTFLLTIILSPSILFKLARLALGYPIAIFKRFSQNSKLAKCQFWAGQSFKVLGNIPKPLSRPSYHQKPSNRKGIFWKIGRLR